MNAVLKLSEFKLREWIEDIKLQYQKMNAADAPLLKEQMLTEQEVCAILSVSDRTMRAYRQRGYFHFMKLYGNIYYIRWIFLLDMACHNLQEKNGDETEFLDNIFPS